MIFVSVGTYKDGFDALVEAMDQICARLSLPGLAQIGASQVVPRAMQWQRFLTHQEMIAHISSARLVVAHAGLGIIGDVLRQGRPLIVFPRAQTIGRDNPANNQLPVARRLAEMYGIGLCERTGDLEQMVSEAWSTAPNHVDYPLQCDIPRLIQSFLCSLS